MYQSCNGSAPIDMGPLQTTNQQHEHMNAELAKLRIENERLQRRKDELELFVEQMRLKESLGPSNGEKEYKVHNEHCQFNRTILNFEFLLSRLFTWQ